MSLRNLLLISVIALSLVACNQSSTNPQNPPATPTPPPLPASGMATVIGRLVNSDGTAVPRTIVSLAEVVRGVEGRGGAYILDTAHSPATRSDEFGYFIFPDIKAAEYVVVIGDVEVTGVYEIIANNDGTAKIFNMPADQVTDVQNILTKIEPPQLVPTLDLTAEPITYPSPGEYPAPAPSLPYPTP